MVRKWQLSLSRRASASWSFPCGGQSRAADVQSPFCGDQFPPGGAASTQPAVPAPYALMDGYGRWQEKRKDKQWKTEEGNREWIRDTNREIIGQYNKIIIKRKVVELYVEPTLLCPHLAVVKERNTHLKYISSSAACFLPMAPPASLMDPPPPPPFPAPLPSSPSWAIQRENG